MSVRAALVSADHHFSRGIFHPLGAAFFSNATYTETVKIIDESGVPIESFSLASSRQAFQFNITTGITEPYLALPPQALPAVAAEIPRYIQLWNRDFAPYSVVNYKKGVPKSLAVSGEEWFRTNNFTVLSKLLVNPLALYGYGDIRAVPAVSTPVRH